MASAVEALDIAHVASVARRAKIFLTGVGLPAVTADILETHKRQKHISRA